MTRKTVKKKGSAYSLWFGEGQASDWSGIITSNDKKKVNGENRCGLGVHGYNENWGGS